MEARCFGAVTVPIPSGAWDPDGDPIQVSAPPSAGLSIPQPLVCTTHQSCSLPVSVSSLPPTCLTSKTVGPLSYTVSDGLASAGPASVYVERICF
jgi:hypothetical protein